MTDALEPPRRTGSIGQYLLLVLGVFACSTAVIMIKKSEAHPLILCGIRLLIAAICLAPLMLLDRRKPSLQSGLFARQLLRSVPGAVLLAVHLISWTIGARMTGAANATLIVNLNAVALPFVMWFVNRERITRGEVLGTAIAIAGVAGLTVTNLSVSASSVPGDAICFGSMLLFCLYIAVGRRVGQGIGLWSYLVPLYTIAGLLCLAVAIIARVPWPPATMREAGLQLALGLVPTVIGHSILNYSIKYLRGQHVSTINLGQFIFAAIMAYFLFGEVPSAKLLIAALVIGVGVVIVIRSSPPPQPERLEAVADGTAE